jgi:diacylglycerol kinase family enzyme
VFACGVGLDATVVERVDSHPQLKARAGHYYYTWAAIAGFYRRYMRDPVRMSVSVNGEQRQGITAIVQNSDPFTYFRSHPVRVCEGVSLDDGSLSLAVLARAAQRDVPTLIPRLLNPRLRAADHRQIEAFGDVEHAEIRSISRDASGSPRPFPVQVDGDFIGEHDEVELIVEPRALTVVA